MIVAVSLPRFPLLVAMLANGTALDTPAALAPAPGGSQIVGLCTRSAQHDGVRAGLRVGEALARCTGLVLIPPDPDAVNEAHERVMARLEALGAAVESQEPGSACFDDSGLVRLHEGRPQLLRRVRAALPVGADGRIGVAPTRFTAQQAARQAHPRRPLVVAQEEISAFLEPLPVGRLPLPRQSIDALWDVGIRTVGAVARLPRTAALERLGFDGLQAWHIARGESDGPLTPRRPPEPIEAGCYFEEPVGVLGTIEMAARLLLVELADEARSHGTSLRALHLRARLSDGGSWTHDIALREATTDPDRLALATLGALAHIVAPVSELAIRSDTSRGHATRQMTLERPEHTERQRRAGEAISQIRSTLGDNAVMQAVALEPWSHLPERQWALVPYDISRPHTPRA
jgi:protein ImuB